MMDIIAPTSFTGTEPTTARLVAPVLWPFVAVGDCTRTVTQTIQVWIAVYTCITNQIPVRFMLLSDAACLGI